MATEKDPKADVQNQPANQAEPGSEAEALVKQGSEGDEPQTPDECANQKCRHGADWLKRLPAIFQERSAAIQAASAVATLVFTGALLCVYTRQMQEMRTQNALTRDALRVNQRAWVLLDQRPHVYNNPLSGRPEFRYTVKNFGNGPARGVRYWAVTLDAVPGQFPRRPKTPILPSLSHSEEGPGILPPNDDTIGLLRDYPLEFTVDRFPVVVGQIKYRDQFGRRHTTRFCQRLVGWGFDSGDVPPSGPGKEIGMSGWTECRRFNWAN